MSKPMPKGDCSISGCSSPVRTRGWCNKHYLRWWKHGGTAVTMGTERGEPLAFYLAHVVDATDDCILWPYGKRTGYGQVVTRDGQRGVHILACEYAHGPKPDGMEVCHACRNRHCFNPRHLRWGTSASNEADKIRDGVVARGERQGNSTLTEAEVIEIRSRALSGRDSQRKIANLFGVTQPTVSRIANAHRWGWFDA